MDIFSLLSFSAHTTGVNAQLGASKRHNALVGFPDELASYYLNNLTQLYAQTCYGDVLSDALINFVVQESSFANWSWHSEKRERVVVQIGGTADASLLAAALGNPRQAIVACPWPTQPVPAQLMQWCQQSFMQSIAPAAQVVFSDPLTLAQESSVPFIGCLIVRDCLEVENWRAKLAPLLQRCDASTDIIVHSRGEASRALSQIMDTVYATVADRSKIRQACCNTPSGQFAIGRGIMRVSEVKFGSEPNLDSLPRVASWCDSPEDLLFEAAAESRLVFSPAKFIGGHGMNVRQIADQIDYMRDGYCTCPAAEYFVLCSAFIDRQGRVYKRDGITLRGASPPYQRVPQGARFSDPTWAKLEGTWLLLSPGGMSHTHFLVDGLLRMWVAADIPNLRGVISPFTFARYQREMFEFALGKLPLVELDTLGSAVQVERLVAWHFNVGHALRVNELVDRMTSSVRPDSERFLFVRRSDRPLYRNCLNESNLLELAQELGYSIVDPGKMSGAEEIRTFASAKVVVGAFGAGINNVLFSPAKTHLITYTAQSYNEPHPFHFAALRDLKISVLFCEQIDAPDSDPSCGKRLSSFFVDERALADLMREAKNS